jgi:hypothetical protein
VGIINPVGLANSHAASLDLALRRGGRYSSGDCLTKGGDILLIRHGFLCVSFCVERRRVKSRRDIFVLCRQAELLIEGDHTALGSGTTWVVACTSFTKEQQRFA